MIITSRQRKAMMDMTENLTQADKKHCFDLKSLAFYMDAQNEVVLAKIDYARTLVNVVDGDVEIYVIDKKGKLISLSMAMSSITEQLAYLQKLEILNTVK